MVDRGKVRVGMPDTEQPPIGELNNKLADWEISQDPGILLSQLDWVLAKLKRDLEKLRETKGEKPLDPIKENKPPVKLKKQPRIYLVTGNRLGMKIPKSILKIARPGDVIKIIDDSGRITYHVVEKSPASISNTRPPSPDEKKQIEMMDVDILRRSRR